MGKIKFKEVFEVWKKEKKMYVKLSTYSAYCLLCENHLILAFWEVYDITEKLVQQYVLNEFNNRSNEKTIKDISIVLKMILRFGVKNNMIDFYQIDIKFLLIMKRKTLEFYLEIIKENWWIMLMKILLLKI